MRFLFIHKKKSISHARGMYLWDQKYICITETLQHFHEYERFKYGSKRKRYAIKLSTERIHNAKCNSKNRKLKQYHIV